MKVKPVTLLALASVVWLIAGANVLVVGINTYKNYVFVWTILLSIVVFALFTWRIFGPLVAKHTKRILESSEPKLPFWHFFDRKSFIIMAVMMSMGIAIRVFGLLPDVVIAFFYTGLGAALFLAGVQFGWNFLCNKQRA